MPQTIAITVTLVATLLLVWSERQVSRVGIWVWKPLASLGFIAFAVALRVESGGAHWVLAALCACALGDVLLIPQDERAFRAGIASFALGHALYGVAFALRGVQVVAALIAAALLSGLAFRVYRWLAPGVPAGLKPAVAGYCAIITLMVVLAIGASVASGDLRFAAGAVLFFVSDLSVARDRFVAPAFVNRAWGLPLYYCAQLVLASTVR